MQHEIIRASTHLHVVVDVSVVASHVNVSGQTRKFKGVSVALMWGKTRLLYAHDGGLKPQESLG